MGWLNKIFKVPVGKVSKGPYKGKSSYHDDTAEQAHFDYHDEGDDEEFSHAIALSLSEQENRNGETVINDDYEVEDELLARALHESMADDIPPRNGPKFAVEIPPKNSPKNAVDVPQKNGPNNGSIPVFFTSSNQRICAGCKNPINHGRYLGGMGYVWHPECFRCPGCNDLIKDYEFALHDDQPFHKACYKNRFHPKCDICNNFIPTNKGGYIEYRAHPYWMQKYCPSHENDGTPRCCSCERMEPRDTRYVTLDDGRKLCLECLNSAIMDNAECQPLNMDIQEFYEGLHMKVEQQIPLLLVERQALNEAIEVEKQGNHLISETRGLCLSEEQIIRTITRRPVIGPGSRIMDLITGPIRLVRKSEVTAILILYGLPRLMTGSILAHEMMHAWLRLKGFRSLSPKVEEGICQVLAHMWLDSEIMSGTGSGSSSNGASTSSGTSSSSSSAGPSKKGAKTEFEKKLGRFLKHQIERDPSSAYGDGFRAGYRAVERYGLRSTIEHIRLTGMFPY